MIVVAQIYSLLMSLLCFCHATKTEATKLERVLFALCSLLFVAICLIIEEVK